MQTYGYNADTEEFTVYDRTPRDNPLAVVKISMADSHKLMSAINRLLRDEKEDTLSLVSRSIDDAIDRLRN